MSLNLHRRDKVWAVAHNLPHTVVAEILLDPWDQVDEVVLYADSSEQVQLEVLRLAASHVRQYVRHRITSAFDNSGVENKDNLTREDSNRLMNFSAIPPEIQEMDRKAAVKSLHRLQVSVVTAVHRRFEDAVEAVLEKIGIAIKYKVIPQRMIFDNEMMVHFDVEEPNSFTFWYGTGRPGPRGSDLYIIPAYHPVMNGKKSVGLVNGATDAYIRGNAVRSIYCPEDAQASDPSKNFGTSWNHVKHPYYAKGRSFEVRLTTKIRSTEGMEELTNVLRAALGLDDKFMEINGGFIAPLKCGHNRLLELGRRSPWPEANYDRPGNSIARGSEQYCVWAYRVLSEEGQLEKAYIPSWFISEGWLQIYEGAEVGHGLY